MILASPARKVWLNFFPRGRGPRLDPPPPGIRYGRSCQQMTVFFPRLKVVRSGGRCQWVRNCSSSPVWCTASCTPPPWWRTAGDSTPFYTTQYTTRQTSPAAPPTRGASPGRNPPPGTWKEPRRLQQYNEYHTSKEKIKCQNLSEY